MRAPPPDIFVIMWWMCAAAGVVIVAYVIYHIWARIPNLFAFVLILIIAALGYLLYVR